MNPVLAQWLPAMFVVFAIWVGLIYNNKRLDDFKDLMNAAIGQAKAELRTEMQTQIMESEKRILQAIAELRADIQNLDRRVARLEAPFIRS